MFGTTLRVVKRLGASLLLSLVSCISFGAIAQLVELSLSEPIGDIAFEPATRQYIIATAPSNGISRVAILTPEPLSIGPTLVEGAGRAIIEPDGIGGVYVAFEASRTVLRHDLLAQTNSEPFIYGLPGMGIINIRIVSPEERLISVARAHANPGFFDTTLFRDGVALADAALYSIVQGVAPGGDYVYSAIEGFQRLKVTPTGIASDITIPGSTGFTPGMLVRGNEVVFGTGTITDLELRPKTVIPSSPRTTFPFPSIAYSDPRTNLIAFVWSPLTFTFVLYAPAASGEIANVTLPLATFPSEIFAWGESSYGLRVGEGDQGRLYIIDLQAVPQSDLALTIEPSSNVVTNGQPVTYTVSLRNDGPAPAENITVYDALTFGAMLNSATGSAGHPELWANEASWRLESLPAGETATMTVAATATGPSIVVNEAVISFGGVDANPKNNVATNILAVDAAFAGKDQLFWMPNSAIASNPDTGDLFVSVAWPRGPFHNSVIRWNPETNEVQQIAGYPVAPGMLALSTDRRYLFVALPGTGEIEQLDLAGEFGAIRFPSGLSAAVGDIDPLPGAPTSVIVSSGIDSRIFDNGVPRINRGPAGYIAVMDEDLAVQYQPDSTLRELAFDASGVLPPHDLPNQPIQGNWNIHFAGGRVFVENGLVLDPSTGAVLDTVPTGKLPEWAFDQTADEFFILSHDDVKWTLKRHQLSALNKLAEVPAPVPLETLTEVVKWGPRDFAYGTPGTVAIFREPVLANSDVAVTGSITPAPPGQPFTWSITVTNRGPAAASNITLTATVDGPALSWKPADSAHTAFPNPFVRIIPNLGAGQSHTLDLSISAASGGHFNLFAAIERFGPDADFLNNSHALEHSLAPAPGVLRSYKLPANDIDFEKTSGRLLMTTALAATNLENSVVWMDLESFQVFRLFSFPTAPGILAAADSADAGFVALEGNTKASQFEIEPRWLFDPNPIGGNVFDFMVRPRTTNVLIVSQSGGVSIYTNGIGAILHDHPSAIALDAGKSDHLFVYEEGGLITRFRLDLPANAAEASAQLPFGGIMPIAAVNNRIIFANGQTVDQDSLEPAGLLPGIPPEETAHLLTVDDATGRIYLYFHGRNSDELAVFDGQSFERLGSLVFPWTQNPVRLRAHNNRVALLDQAPNGFNLFQVHIFEIPPADQVELSASAQTATALLDVPSALTVLALNNAPWTASNAVLELQFPPGFTFDSAGINAYELTENGVRISLPALSGGAPESVQIVGSFSAPGTNTIHGTIRSDATDYLAGNNTFSFAVRVVPRPILSLTNGFQSVSNVYMIDGRQSIIVHEGQLSLGLPFYLSHSVPGQSSFTMTVTNGSVPVNEVLLPTNLVQTISFNPNSTRANARPLRIQPNNDPHELRTLNVVLSDPVNLQFAETNLTITIVDDDGSPILLPDRLQPVMERPGGAPGSVRFLLNRPGQAPARFRYRFVSVTAVEGADFLGEDGEAVMNVPVVQIPFQVLGDGVAEGPETFRIELSDPENIQLLVASLTVTILDGLVASGQILDIQKNSDRITVRFSTAAQQVYRLLRSPGIASPEWRPVGDTAHHSTGSAELIDFDPAPHRQMFYHIEQSSQF